MQGKFLSNFWSWKLLELHRFMKLHRPISWSGFIPMAQCGTTYESRWPSFVRSIWSVIRSTRSRAHCAFFHVRFPHCFLTYLIFPGRCLRCWAIGHWVGRASGEESRDSFPWHANAQSCARSSERHLCHWSLVMRHRWIRVGSWAGAPSDPVLHSLLIDCHCLVVQFLAGRWVRPWPCVTVNNNVCREFIFENHFFGLKIVDAGHSEFRRANDFARGSHFTF